MKDWKSTFVGIIIALAVIFRQLANYVDGDPSTVFDWAMFSGGGLFALFSIVVGDSKKTPQ